MDRETYLDVGASPRRFFGNRRGMPAAPVPLAMRIAMGAAHLGIPVEEYERHVADGDRWCTGHRRWCPAGTFGPTNNRCRPAAAEYQRARVAAKKAGGIVPTNMGG